MLLRFRTCLDCNVRELDAVRRQTEVWILAGQQDKYYETERYLRTKVLPIIILEYILYLCCGFFFGTAARGTLQDAKRERPTSHFAAL